MNIVEPIRDKKDLYKVEKVLLNESGLFGIRNLLFFLFGTNCGLRISDILNLNVYNVKNRSYVELTEIKTGKKKKFPINDKLRPLIAEYTKNRNNNEPLFLSKNNNRLERTQCYRILNNACKKAGIDYKVGTHTLRKTFGYHHYKKYKDIAILQKIFNHSSPQVTLIYIGINQDILDDSYRNFIL
ncbi:MAG: tyrosine-type recombinase/integrase [Candidatus Gastranaerophilaceae bacterium]